MVSSQWLNAQKAERNYHPITGRRHKHFKNTFLYDVFNLPKNYFTNKVVLEIGVTPHSHIHYLDDDTKLKIGVDPLACFFNPDTPKSALNVQGRGEELPVKNNTIDIVIFLNTLDHTEKPHVVLQEIKRVLNKKGQLLFSINTFQTPEFFRRKVMAKFDTPHPHHFSENEVITLLKSSGFQVTQYSYYEKALKSWAPYCLKTLSKGQVKPVVKYLSAKLGFRLQYVMIKCNAA